MKIVFVIMMLCCAVACIAASARPAMAASCREQVGAAQAELFVRECLAITSATHPPCNADNDCATIGAHIQYMCRQTPHPPGWCKAYASTPVPMPPPSMAAVQPGFDCGKAETPVDREICAGGHDWIALDDRKMSDLYAHLLAGTADPAELRASQREFLRQRAQCAAPERGQTPHGLQLTHCIGELTHERIDELERLAGSRRDAAWDAFSPPCQAYFGDDGWDQVGALLSDGNVIYTWADLRQQVLRTGDVVAFDVDGTAYPARLVADEDGDLTAVSADPKLIAALAHGRMVRVTRNGKTIARAPLASFPAAYAKAKQTCGEARP